MKLILVLLLTSCTSSVPRTISVTGGADLGKQAVETWGMLGFTYVHDGGDITINIRREVYTSEGCGGCVVLGHAQDTKVWVDPDLVGDAAQHVARHEFGHILLETSDHLPNTKMGIMNASPYRNGVPTWILEPTQDDYDLACQTIGVCI